MGSSEIRIVPITCLPEIQAGDQLAALIERALVDCGLRIRDSDILVLAQKVVSKAEGRLVPLAAIEPSRRAREWASEHGRDARVIELVFREAKQLIRAEQGVIITETRHGFICANAGIDTSNVPPGCALLLPEDPDASAERLRAELGLRLGHDLGVIISDTFGRPWREGLVNVALGVAGLSPVTDYRGTPDAFGKCLKMTVIATADELAAAAELVMGKANRVPAVLIRGFEHEPAPGSGKELLRRADRDLFR